MLAAFHNVQGVDSGDAGVRLQIHGSEDPAVIGGLAELGGSAEANGGILLAGGTDSLGDRVGGGGEDRFVGVQTLQELITGVLAAVGQLQLFAVQGLIGLGQTVRPTQKPVIQEPQARLSRGFCIMILPFHWGSVSCQILVMGEPSG